MVGWVCGIVSYWERKQIVKVKDIHTSHYLSEQTFLITGPSVFRCCLCSYDTAVVYSLLWGGGNIEMSQKKINVIN